MKRFGFLLIVLLMAACAPQAPAQPSPTAAPKSAPDEGGIKLPATWTPTPVTPVPSDTPRPTRTPTLPPTPRPTVHIVIPTQMGGAGQPAFTPQSFSGAGSDQTPGFPLPAGKYLIAWQYTDTSGKKTVFNPEKNLQQALNDLHDKYQAQRDALNDQIALAQRGGDTKTVSELRRQIKTLDQQEEAEAKQLKNGVKTALAPPAFTLTLVQGKIKLQLASLPGNGTGTVTYTAQGGDLYALAVVSTGTWKIDVTLK